MKRKSSHFVKFSSLTELEVIILTTSSAANGENFVKIMAFPFQLIQLENHLLIKIADNL